MILFHNSVIFLKKIWLNVQSRPGSVTDLCVVQVSIHVPALVSNKIRRTNLLIHDKKRRQHVSRTILYKICVMFLVDNATHLITLFTYVTIIDDHVCCFYLLEYDLLEFNPVMFFLCRLFLQHTRIVDISPLRDIDIYKLG